MRIFHVTATAARYPTPLCDFPLAPVVWHALRHAFPHALGSCLMREHTHVVTPGESAKEVRLRMTAAQSAVRRSRHGAGLLWLPVDPPPEILDPKHLTRSSRYLALNPSRNGLVADPLEWLWSTHRDVLGAVVDPWITADRLADALARPARDFAKLHHRYVSADPTVCVVGTSYPEPAIPSRIAIVPLGDVLAAAAAAHRAHPAEVRHRGPVRATFLSLALESGWDRWATLGRVANCCDTTIWNHARRARPVPAAARLCLGDRRLLAPYARLVPAELRHTFSSREMVASSAPS